jgi:polyhydroxyalkanoate synthesis repressor PhaR
LTHKVGCGPIPLTASRQGSRIRSTEAMSEQDQTHQPVESGSDASEARKEPKVIKRYTNRKLYDTVESRYVTLDEIAQMIKGGAEVKIIDNRSKEDLTSVTLAQIIFEEEKKRSQMPLGVLREIIRHGGEAVAGFYQEKVGSKITAGLEDVKTKTETLRENIEQRVRGVTQLLRREGEEINNGAVKDVLTAGQSAVEELRAKVEESVKQALDSLGSTAVTADIERLRGKIDALEKKIDELGK